MDEKCFIFITLCIFGFSLFPLVLLIYFGLSGKSTTKIIFLVSSVEIFNSICNFILYILDFQNNKYQFYVYYFLEIVCWLLVFRLIQKQTRFARLQTPFVLGLTLFMVYTGSLTFLELFSKGLEFALGMSILKLCVHNHKFSNPNFFLSIGLILYSVSSTNIFIFNNQIIKVSDFHFYAIWSTHQFAALFYYVLLSISIWKSQKI